MGQPGTIARGARSTHVLNTKTHKYFHSKGAQYRAQTHYPPKKLITFPMAPPLQRSTAFAERALVLVPTCNPGVMWGDFLRALQNQNPVPAKVVIIDSESTDGQIQEVQGLHVHRISRASFSHGGTRQEGIERFVADAEFVVFLTQDALLADASALETLLSAFEDPQVAAVYGRQLPHADATPLAAHARLFNYPATSHTVNRQNSLQKGIKACFLSNSFAAYRCESLLQVGGFAKDVILGEDTHLAARLLLAGKSIRYEASACVYHSHNYSLRAELGRYFDTGVFHAQHDWLLKKFGRAGHEGMRFAKSEMSYLWNASVWCIPEAALRTALKFVGYRLGLLSKYWPVFVNKCLSMHKGYWV